MALASMSSVPEISISKRTSIPVRRTSQDTARTRDTRSIEYSQQPSQLTQPPGRLSYQNEKWKVVEDQATCELFTTEIMLTRLRPICP